MRKVIYCFLFVAVLLPVYLRVADREIQEFVENSVVKQRVEYDVWENIKKSYNCSINNLVAMLETELKKVEQKDPDPERWWKNYGHVVQPLRNIIFEEQKSLAKELHIQKIAAAINEYGQQNISKKDFKSRCAPLVETTIFLGGHRLVWQASEIYEDSCKTSENKKKALSLAFDVVEYAAKYCEKEMISFSPDPLGFALAKSGMGIIRYFFEKDTSRDLNEPCKEDMLLMRTNCLEPIYPLECACKNPNPKALKFVIEHGSISPVQRTTTDGWDHDALFSTLNCTSTKK